MKILSLLLGIAGFLLVQFIFVNQLTAQDSTTNYLNITERGNKNWFWNGRISPLKDPHYKLNFDLSLNQNLSTTTTNQNAWQELGPNTKLSLGIGRVSSVAFHPTDPNTLYIGTSYGGVYKSTNGGDNWALLNTDDQLPVTSVTDIEVSSNNTLYVATGERTEGRVGSRGVYRSSNGGLSYHGISNGLPWDFYVIEEIFMLSNDIMFAATSQGIYRTSNAQSSAVSWSKVGPSEPFQNIIKHPTNGTLYASGYGIYQSNDNGLTWTAMTGVGTGIDVTTSSFTSQISGSPVKDRRFTISISNSPPYTFYTNVVFTSVDAFRWGVPVGHLFFKHTGSSWQNLGSRPKGGAENPYARGLNNIIASPVNANVLYFASTVLITYDANASPQFNVKPYSNSSSIHADIVSFKFSPYDSNMLYICTDGFLAKYNCATKSFITINNEGLANATIYGLSVHPTLGNVMIGTQDAGSSIYKDYGSGSFSWDYFSCGDGYQNLQFDNTIYYICNSQLYRKKGGASQTIKPYNIEPIWPTKIIQDPIDPTIAYYSARNIWKYTLNDTGNKISDFQNTFDVGIWQVLNVFAIAPTDNNVIYAAFEPHPYYEAADPNHNKTRLFKTTNGGTSWSEITSLPQPQTHIPLSGIEVSPYDPNVIYVSYRGYNPSFRVKKFTGSQWIDYNNSTALPTDRQINTMIFEPGSNNALYIGTDVGIYYTNATMTGWIPYTYGLPNVIVTDLKINGPTLYAATYGRGAWKNSLYCPSVTSNLVIPGATATDNFYETTASITSTAVVASNAKTYYRAGDAINLQPGFLADNASGVIFFGYIHTCSDEGTIVARMANKDNNEKYSALTQQIPDEEVKEEFLWIYPIPSTGPFTVKFKIDQDEVVEELGIYNLTGRKIVDLDKNNPDQMVDIDLDPEIHLVRIKTNKRTAEKKIIIHKTSENEYNIIKK